MLCMSSLPETSCLSPGKATLLYVSTAPGKRDICLGFLRCRERREAWQVAKGNE